MDPLWILLVGVVVVIGGILWLKLHAFLALLLGALVVGLLTPLTAVQQQALEETAGTIVSVSDDGTQVTLRPPKSSDLRPNAPLLAYPARATENYLRPAELQLIDSQEIELAGKTSRVWTARLLEENPKVQAGDLVVDPIAAAAATKRATTSVGERVAQGFGRTCASIGIIIALAAIIGDCLLASGAADRIVRSTLKLVGEPRAPVAFVSSGFLLGIPVFFDTVFYLLIPLGKAMRLRTGRNYLLYVLTIVAGATMTHSLVPPTPGPLAAADLLGVNIGLMMLGGIVVGLFTSGFGLAYAIWANRRWDLPLRETPELPLAELEQLAHRDESELPPFWLAILPILLPVLLIAGLTVIQSAWKGDLSGVQVRIVGLLAFFGDKNIALLLGAAIALLMLARQKRTSRKELAVVVQKALAGGAVIILITAAGGAFGAVLQQTGIGSRIQQLATQYQVTGLGILVLAFGVTTLIRTAQGSATVAMLTAAGILSGFEASQLGFHPLYLALAVGCGSKPFAWMNDSGFWVICKMSGMTEAETLRYVTPMTATMGFIGLAVTMIGASLWPLVGA